MVTIEEVKEDAGERNAGLALYLRKNIRQQREAREAEEAGREQIVAEQEEPRPGSVEEMREGLEDQRRPEDEENVSESGSQRQDPNIRIDQNRVLNDLDMDETDMDMDNVDDVIVESENDDNSNIRHMQNDEDLDNSDMILLVRVAPTARQNATDWEALGFSPDDVEDENDESH
ncbi:hypothetical protein GCK72_005055 [Caenorhabditis remanei]|uniref:Uncharacterized protein n=1 Tax=Caenorhabditis remanei TaxID=31234 RepID=A0A6A5HFH1_CAERE|nr:hypothetical protein GCK72_005055 [Caenorhabditis remanei]KAF1765103.1 hypothetical protein GCK72_005055 [Caenorhabditis remanei]